MKGKEKVFVSPKMNLDVHYSLLDNRDLVYLRNGDISGQEGNNNSWFVQNQLSNSICYPFPSQYEFCGEIKLDNFIYVLFFHDPIGDTSEIGTLDSNMCDYNLLIRAKCLNFNPDSPIRGVYKHNANQNDRRIYWVDGLNPNRYLDIDRAMPMVLTSDFCVDCEKVYSEDLDCEKIKMIKNVKPPCSTLSVKTGGFLSSGVYQIGIGFGEDDLVLTDYYFSAPVKLFSEQNNLSLSVKIGCIGEQYFSQMQIILVTNTRESSLVVYKIGTFKSDNKTLTIVNLSNTTILSTSEALSKKVNYDKSFHIATNSETLLLGKHTQKEPMNYQIKANHIDVRWGEYKVKASESHKYPSLMRDEIYSLAIEWFDLQGKSRGKFHIPGPPPEDFQYTDDPVVILNPLDVAPEDEWYEKNTDCTLLPAKIFEVINTASVTSDLGIQCTDCDGPRLSRIGKMGYWQSRDFKYPSDETIWEDLACQPIRHHRMPSHDKSHIYGDLLPYGSGEDLKDVWQLDDNGCVNILGVILNNVQYPTNPDGTPDLDISGYRIHYGDRIDTGNQTILHKGLLFNGRVQIISQTNGDVEIIYPNYPYNDNNPDVFISTTQTNDQSGSENFTAVDNFSYLDTFYHSPDIHYRESKREIGSYITEYTEEIGIVGGIFRPVYKHPSIALGKGGTPANSGLVNYAYQADSISLFNKAYPLHNPFGNFFYENNQNIIASQYLLPIKQNVRIESSDEVKKINNLFREESYYLRLQVGLYQTFEDTTRILASEIDCGTSAQNDDIIYYSSTDTVNRGGTDKPIQSVASMVGVKIRQPNQYADLETIKYLPMNECIHRYKLTQDPEDNTPIFINNIKSTGGDVYISLHSILKKFPLFKEWLYDVPFDTEYNYREHRNIDFPRFWYDNLTQADDQYRLDCFSDINSGSDETARGKFYLFVNGILNFYCESQFVADYRESDITPNGSFYPRSTDEELFRSDKFTLPEKFLYNLTLLNEGIESGYQDLNPPLSDADFTVIYSQKDDIQSTGDRWLQFLPLNYHILPRIYGRFTHMHYIDEYSIFFVFENMILYSQVNFTQNTNEGNTIFLSQGDIFDNRLRKLSNEDSGYCGSVDPYSFINTRYGTFFVDRFRKKFFRWDGQLHDITGEMSSWLNKYLEHREIFHVNSLQAVYDNYTDKVYFTENVERSLNRWTLSYKPKTDSFISFHDFIPERYLVTPNGFMSINGSGTLGVWKHNIFGDYQRYYGIQYPFEVGFIVKDESNFKNVELQAIELFSEWIKYNNYGDSIYKKDKFFDKVFAYNNNGSTGLMNTYIKNKSNPLDTLKQNANNTSPLTIEITQTEDSIYRFNKFQSIRVDHDNQPLVTWDASGFKYTPVSVDSTINPINRSDIKGKWIKLNLISSTNHEHKILVQLLSPDTDDIIK